MIKVGIVGGTGYTGVELLRILAGHPEVSLEVITSRSEEGREVADLFPNLRGSIDIRFSQPDIERLCDCETVFFATPNGTAMTMVPQLINAGARVIDLAADFRLQDPEAWSQWYGMLHACPDYLEQAVYGLPEINRDAIRRAQLIANPGCYPTAVQLGFLPLIEAQVVDIDSLIVDAKSAVSGAGRKAATGNLLCEAGENFKAYAVSGHRHLPEICQGLEAVAGGPVGLTFVPHLTPMIRGIHATLYARLNDPDRDLQALYEARYSSEYFVDILSAGQHPETRSVRGTNHCRIAIHQPQAGGVAVVLSVIDNLVKGAAGQAVQNMNIMQGFDEQLGLTSIALLP